MTSPGPRRSRGHRSEVPPATSSSSRRRRTSRTARSSGPARRSRAPPSRSRLTLPWMTGAPYAAYARVRAVTRNGTSAWSAGYGFNIRWKDVPKQATSYPGLARWTPVEGATSYQVWFTGINRVVETRVNAVDQREFYAFHQGANFTGAINWRVRAVRRVAKLQGFITPVNYGPWSPTFTSKNPAMDDGVVHPVAAVTALATSTPTQPEGARDDAGVRVRRHARRQREQVRLLPGLRLQRPAVRQHGLPRCDRRRPRVRCPEQGHDQASDRREGRHRRREPDPRAR